MPEKSKNASHIKHPRQAHMRARTHTHTHMRAHMYTHMHTHMCTHVCTYTCIHTHKPGTVPKLTCSVLQPVTLIPAHRAWAALSLLKTLNWTNPATNSPGKEEAEKEPRIQRTNWKYLPFDHPRNSLNQQVWLQPICGHRTQHFSTVAATSWPWERQETLPPSGARRPRLRLTKATCLSKAHGRNGSPLRDQQEDPLRSSRSKQWPEVAVGFCWHTAHPITVTLN